MGDRPGHKFRGNQWTKGGGTRAGSGSGSGNVSVSRGDWGKKKKKKLTAKEQREEAFWTGYRAGGPHYE